MSGHHLQNFRSLSRGSGLSEPQHIVYFSTLFTSAHCPPLTLLAFPWFGDDKGERIANDIGGDMKITIVIIATFVVLVESVYGSHGKDDDSKLVTDWKKDPVCKAVYDAVLQGLYRNRVSDKIVTNIVGNQAPKNDRKTLRQRMKRSFVLDCPLCEPTFAAFLAYQSRKSNRIPKSTRGVSKRAPGLTATLQKKLLSNDTETRLRGLAPLVQQWVLAKLESNTVVKPVEILEWKKRVEQKSNQGRSKLLSLMKNTKDYRQWSPYWGCAACNGSRDATRTWKIRH